MNSLPKTVTRQRREGDLNPGLSVPESSTLTTRLLSHPVRVCLAVISLTAFRHRIFIHKTIDVNTFHVKISHNASFSL